LNSTKRALISVFDKRGVKELAKELVDLGFQLISTGGTARYLEEAGLEVEKVEDLTGFPEILGGRVKTLHPKIHAGLLARDLPEDRKQLEQLGISPIDLVVVNLYPFQETVSRPGVTLAEALEQIDIGGVTLIRAAAKNFSRVAVVVNPDRYQEVLEELREKGEVSLKTRFSLAREAFWHTANYDRVISEYFHEISLEDEGELSGSPERSKFPERFLLPLVKLQDLRYGENPHQEAAFYREEPLSWGIVSFQKLQGKELSFNNILDLEAAFQIASEFAEPAAVVIKHNTPSGVACDSRLSVAFRKAFQADAVAAYGGIVGLNKTVDDETAEALTENFLEAVVAPAYSEAALKVLEKRKNLRLISLGELPMKQIFYRNFKQVSGGFLVQDPDFVENDLQKLWEISKVVTKREPSSDEWEDLLFAWIVVRHVFSNGIVVARGKETLGIGNGQVSRIAAARIALEKAGEKAKGAVLASDGFLPFPDTVELAAEFGVTAIIQPGGSIRDQEVITAADAKGLAMVFTGKRHFRH